MKKLVLAIIAIVVIIGLVAVVYAMLPTSTRAIARPVAAGDSALIEKGRYLAVAGDCTACHTRPGGAAFAGGLPIASPIGTIYSTNITPDKDTGIGNYTLDDFDRAVRHGIAANGDTLYPAMPYPSYAHMSDEDVRALYAYFMSGQVAAVSQPNQAADIPWPMSMRWPLAIWRKQFAPDPDTVAVKSSRYPSAKIARGAYLVQGAGHCGTCHTPRSWTLAEKALDDSSPDYLAGGQVIDGWFAVNLRGNKADGLGNWSEQDIVDTLRKARNDHSAVVGSPMAEVAVHSTQHMSDDDLHAIAAYLKTLPASANDASSFTADSTTASKLQAGVNDSRGAEVYVDNCAACHRTDAKGYDKVFPAIAGNPTVLADDPATLIRLILIGSKLPSTQQAPSPLGMPAFGYRLSDDEVAQLATFVRGSWGNHASPVTAAQVAAVRAKIDPDKLKPSGEVANDEGAVTDKLH